MKLTEREIWMLHYLIYPAIEWYIKVNSLGWPNYGEKADLHIEISIGLCNFVLCEGTKQLPETRNTKVAYMNVHDYLANILTDRMDDVIDFPIDKRLEGEEFKVYADKFFNVVLDHLGQITKIINKAVKGAK